jgi:tetratricopeptide (TPR) repeat protein
VVAAERAVLRSHCLARLFASIARNRLAAGDVGAALEALREGERLKARHGTCATCNALLLPEAVRVNLGLAQVEEAERHAAELERIAHSYGSRAWCAMARQARGRVLHATGQPAPAVRAFAEAAEAYLASDNRYEAARCLLAQGRLLDPAAAQPILGQAREILDALGAPGIEE